MTAGRQPDRERAAVEALIADHYLDALLAAAERHAEDAPADAALAPELRDAARVLRQALVRVHPSFRFEERLASRLAELAAAQARPLAATAGGSVVPFTPARGSGTAPEAPDPLLAAILAGELDPADDAAAGARPAGARRPLLLGGALTSAALSLVGVAWVAWRTSRPGTRASGASMDGAARLAAVVPPAATALAMVAGLAGGAGGLA